MSPTEILIVRIGTDFDDPFGLASSLLKQIDHYELSGEVLISSPGIIIIDAADDGRNVSGGTIEFALEPGRYDILTYVYEPDNMDLMVPHIMKIHGAC